MKGQTPSDKGGYIEKMLFFFTDDAFMQHREAKRMLLDVSRPVVLMGLFLFRGQFIAFGRLFSHELGRVARRRHFGM